jgi:tetratricopeptide (TPR) repeat protein
MEPKTHNRHRLHTPALILLAAVLVLSGCTRAQKEARFMSKGDKFFDAGNFDTARIEYLNALRLNPKNSTACLKIGVTWLQQGDVLEALRYLSAARDISPDNVEIHSRLATPYYSLGDVVAARKEALAVLKQNPGDGEALLMVVNCIRAKADADSAAAEIANFPNKDTAQFHLASAIFHFRSGDRAAAEGEVHQAIAIDPKSYEAHLALGDIAVADKDTAGAEQEFKSAADLAPPRNPAQLRYAQFEMQSGAPDKASAILADIAKTTPDYMPAALMQDQIAFTQKKYDEALTGVSNILMRDPANLDAHLLQSQLWLAKNDPKSAIQDLQSLTPPYSTMPVVKYQLAQAFAQNGDMTGALAALKDAVTASPNYADAVMMLASIQLRGGDAQDAIQPLQRILKIDPGLDRARLLLTDAYRTLKQYDNALALFQDQISRNPQDAQSWFMMGMTQVEKGDLASARYAFERAQDLSPQNLLPTYQLLDLDLAAQDYPSAFKRVQVQMAAQPDSGGAQYLLGKIYVAQKDWPNAVDALTKSLKLNPNLELASETLTSVYIAEKQTGKAIAEVQNFLANNPRNPGALMLLGNLYQDDNQIDKARETYEQLVSIDPNNGPAMNNLAYIYSQNQGDLDKADAMAEKARAILPGDPGVADTLGWILYKKGDYRHALALLQESASRPPVSPEVFYHLGMADYMMDIPDAALTAFRQAQQSPSTFTGKDGIAAKIATLQNGGYLNSTPDQLEAILKLEPGDPYAQIALGDAWARQSQWTKAADAYNQALAQNPSLTNAALSLAGLEVGPLHDPDKASDLATQARDLAPSDPRADAILGRVAYARHDFLQAYNLLEQALSSGTNDSSVTPDLDDFAWATYSQGKISDARAIMQRIVAAAPPAAPEAQDAQSFLALTDPQAAAAAQAQVPKLLAATPDYVPALMLRAQSRDQQGDSQGATADYTAALQRFPDFSPAEKQLARLLSSDPANLAKAYDLAVKAHNNLPDDPDAGKILAVICYKRKDYAYAAQLFQDSASKSPLDAPSLYYLGMSLLQTNHKSDSRDTLQQAIAAGLKDPQLADANRVLAQLQKK